MTWKPHSWRPHGHRKGRGGPGWGFLAASLVLALSPACEPTPAPHTNTDAGLPPEAGLAALTIAPGELTLKPRATGHLRGWGITPAGDKVDGLDLTWVSGQPGIAAIDNGGRVTALAPGRAEITIVHEGLTSPPAAVTVEPDTSAPVFAGITSVQAVPGGAFAVIWPTASDDVTPAGEISYLVYAQPYPAAELWESDPTVVVGGLGTVLGGFAAGKAFVFGLRARDEAGNTSPNEGQITAAAMTSGETVPLYEVVNDPAGAGLTGLVPVPELQALAGVADGQTLKLFGLAGEKPRAAGTVDLAAPVAALASFERNGNVYLAAATTAAGVAIVRADPDGLQLVSGVPIGTEAAPIIGVAPCSPYLFALSRSGVHVLQAANPAAVAPAGVFPAAADPALIACDANRQRVWVADASGVLSLFHYNGAGALTLEGSYAGPVNPLALHVAGPGVRVVSRGGEILGLEATGGRVGLFQQLALGEGLSGYSENGPYAAAVTTAGGLHLFGASSKGALTPIGGVPEPWAAGAVTVAEGYAAVAGPSTLHLFDAPPFVVEVTPEAGAILPSADGTLAVTFSKLVEPADGDWPRTVAVRSAGAALEVEVTPPEAADLRLRVPPAKPWPANALISLELTAALAGRHGTALLPSTLLPALFTTASGESLAPGLCGIQQNHVLPGESVVAEGINLGLDDTPLTVTLGTITVAEFTLESGDGAICANQGGSGVKAPAGGYQRLVFAVPADAVTGALQVKGPYGAGEAPARVYVLHPPVIDGMNPAQAEPGATVRIQGRNFGAVPTLPLAGAAVEFNGVPAEVVNWYGARDDRSREGADDTEIVVKVPEAANSGSIAVHTRGGSAFSAAPFIVLRAPVIGEVTPLQGVPGDTVTIGGMYFGATQDGEGPEAHGTVRFGVFDAEVLSWSDQRIEARVPDGARDGPILVTTQYGFSAQTPTFVVFYTPEVGGFSPVRGGAGQEVLAHGANFSRSSPFIVEIGGSARASVIDHQDDYVLFSITPANTTSVVRVTNAGGLSAVSKEVFQVMKIAAVKPLKVPPGDIVDIGGENFGAIPGSVAVGGAPWEVESWSNTRIIARTPLTANSGELAVTSGDIAPGTVRGPQLTVLIDPVIAVVTPPRSGVGSQIAITGTHFGAFTAGASRVLLNGAPVPVDPIAGLGTWSDTQITAKVPEGATSGLIEVITGDELRAVSPKVFLVMAFDEPVTFVPDTGTAMTEVEIRGENFGIPATVTLGSRPAKVTAFDPAGTFVRVTVDPEAKDGKAELFSADGGYAASKRDFKLLAPVVQSVEPKRAGPERIVTLRGRNFQALNAISAIKANGVQATQIQDWDYVSKPELVRFRVPKDDDFAGPITLVNAAGHAGTSVDSFTWVPPPAIGSVEPPDGPVAYEFTILGTSFDTSAFGSGTTALIGGVAAVTKTLSASSLRVTVPALAAGSYDVRVVTDGGEAQAPQPFRILAAPAIASFAPPSGPAGTKVTLTGAGFEVTQLADMAVTFADRPATFAEAAVSSLAAFAPVGVETGRVRFKARGGRAESAGPFFVTQDKGAVLPASIKTLRDFAIGQVGASRMGLAAEPGTRAVKVLNLATFAVVDTFPATGTPVFVASTPTGGAIVALTTAGIERWDAVTKAPGTPVPMSFPGTPTAFAVADTRAVVTLQTGPTTGLLTIVDLVAGTAANSLVDANPVGMAYQAQADLIYLLKSGPVASAVQILKGATGTDAAAAVPLGTDVRAIALGNGGRMYVTSGAGNKVVAIAPKGLAYTTVDILLADAPEGLAMLPGNHRLLVQIPGKARCYVIDTDTFEGSPESNPRLDTLIGALDLPVSAARIVPLPEGVAGSVLDIVLANFAQPSLRRMATGVRFGAPRVFAVTPEQGKVGDAVVIRGLGFGASQGNGKVFYEGLPQAAVTNWTDTEVRAAVPQGAVTGRIRVVTDTGRGESPQPFKVNP